ncbi:MAG: RDD family protein [Bacillota bacterium]|nr:RDD family protein [Bacillota bacterium]
MEENKQKLNYTSMGRRSGAFFLDAIIAIVFGFIIYMTLGTNVLLGSFGYYEARGAQVNMGKSAGLYMADSTSEYNAYYIEAETYLDYENAVYNYYAVWLPDQVAHAGEEGYYPIDDISSSSKVTTYGLDYYNQVVLGLGTEVGDDGSYGNTYYTWALDESGNINTATRAVLKSDVAENSSDLLSYWFNTSYYSGVYYEAITHLSNQSYYVTYTNQVNNAVTLASLPAVLGSILIFYFIIPVCVPKGRTLGKLIMRCSLLSKDGYILPRYRVAIRQAVFVVVLSLLAIPYYSVLVLIGVMALLMGDFLSSGTSKQQMCFHDRLAGSVVVDTKGTHFFKDEEEEEAFYAENPEAAQEDYYVSHPEARPGALYGDPSMHKGSGEDILEAEVVEPEEATPVAENDEVEPEDIDDLSSLDGK